MISPHLEVESNNPEGVQKGLSLLELTGKDVGDLDVEIIFKDCGMDFHSFAVLKF